MVGYFKCHQMVSSHLSGWFLAGSTANWTRRLAIENATVCVCIITANGCGNVYRSDSAHQNRAPITNVLLIDTSTSALMDDQFQKREQVLFISGSNRCYTWRVCVFVFEKRHLSYSILFRTHAQLHCCFCGNVFFSPLCIHLHKDTSQV